MPGFTHLHVHSEYSLLDGLARVPDLVGAAKEAGFDALALTDHGVMYGAIQFYQQAVKAGIKPIVGCELYVAARTRHDRESRHDSKSFHLTCLARDMTGYRNLVELVSLAQLEGFYYKPRVDREVLERHSEGLIVLSGCPSSEVSRLILDGRMDAARECLAWYRDVFGDGYYVEIQNHDIDFLPELNRGLVSLADELDLPLVATNDVHYARAQDARAHEVLLCVQTGTTMNDAKRMKIGDSFYLRTEQEMRALFPELPHAITTTAEIAEKCDLTFSFEGYRLPVFEVPAGLTPPTYLEQLCRSGLAIRYGQVTDDINRRLEYELGVINQMGFADYFLIVWDLCRFARDEGIWWNVRGSGAGALVSYALGITNIDPLAHALIFERFLNPSRISMPDIDLDFPDDQREVLIRYTYEKYGRDRVAQIITFGTMGARAAIRDAGRALDMPLTEVDRVARLMPAITGKPCKIEDALRPPTAEEPNEFYAPELVDLAHDRDDIAGLLDTAKSLEGVARHASTHAAGVVIADAPLVNYLPLHRSTRSSDDDATALPVTQYAMNDVEKLGLLKVDFLGLSTLTILRRAAEQIERYHGTRYTLDSIPLDDKGIYELLSSGHVTGVFQVEGAGMRRMLKEMQPSAFEHVVAAIALYRPGPMEYIPSYIARMHGREKVRYRHDSLRPILEETFGIIVYQEQIIQIARDLAGYDAGEADTIRKAVGKKIKAQLVKHHEQFVEGAVANAIPRDTAEAIWADIETFARYGFNKAHAADYAVIVCQTAYFKAHYPVEYMSALLSVERNNTDKIGMITADVHRMGIKLLPPTVNASHADFTIEQLSDADASEEGIRRRRGIRFGLAAVKNVGEGAVETILDARGEGPFADLEDFCHRVDIRLVGKRALESLIRVGALDSLGPRHGLLAGLDQIAGYSGSHHEAASRGQLSLFGEDVPGLAPPLLTIPDVPPDPDAALQWEKDLIGLYLSDHPLQRLAENISEAVTVMIGDIDESLAGNRVTLAGLVASVRPITTRKGEAMAFARLEDLQGGIEVILFPRVYDLTRELWTQDRLVVVDGTVEVREERVQLLADSAREYDPDEAADSDAAGAEAHSAAAESAAVTDVLSAPVNGATEARIVEPAEAKPNYELTVTLPRSEDMDTDIGLLTQVHRILTEFQGSDRYKVRVPNGVGTVELEFPNATTRYCVSLTRKIEALVGEGKVQANQL